MTEHLLDIKITQPGRATGQYHTPDTNTLRLEKIIHPRENLPFDVGILPTALNPFNEPLATLVLGDLSHPINTEMETRLLGALQRNAEAPVLLVSPIVDERVPHCQDEISAEQHAEITAILHRMYPGKWCWLTVEEVEPELHVSALRFRQRQADGRIPHLDPAWQPIRMSCPTASFAEAGRHTAAEYTFYDLPHRFQHYIGEYLAPDERILYGARRPVIFSGRKRSWFRREQLQEGVLILTSQRLIQLAELVPPDSANIRYGFHAVIGVLERLAGATLTSLGSNLILQTRWHALGGEAIIEWESPDRTRASLDELVSFLSDFHVDADACALRRATLPPAPEELPLLVDTASSDPGKLIPMNEQFSAAVAGMLAPGEQVRAWALLPKWFEHQKMDRVLVITEKRIFILPDRSLEIPPSHKWQHWNTLVPSSSRPLLSIIFCRAVCGEASSISPTRRRVPFEIVLKPQDVAWRSFHYHYEVVLLPPMPAPL